MPIIIEQDTYPQEGVGHPDYTAAKPLGQVPGPTTWTLTDLAEHAARVGSIVTHDRRGDVIWYDDFEDNFNKWDITFGVNAEYALSIAHAHRGAQSCRLTTDAIIDRQAKIWKYLAFPVFSRMGYEIHFTFNNNMRTYSWEFIIYDGVNFYRGAVMYQRSDGHIWLQTSLGWIDLGAIAFGISGLVGAADYLFNVFKLVINPTTSRYERLIFNNLRYDISVHSLVTGLSAISPLMVLTFEVRTDLAVRQTAYVDDCIVTQNEPANIQG